MDALRGRMDALRRRMDALRGRMDALRGAVRRDMSNGKISEGLYSLRGSCT